MATTLSSLLGKRLGYDVEVIARQDFIDLQTAKAYATELERLTRQYHLQQGRIASIRLGYTSLEPREFGVVHYNPSDSEKKTLSLRAAFEKKYKDIAVDSSRCDDANVGHSTATHEFAHLMHQFRDKASRQFAIFESEIESVYSRYMKEFYSLTRSGADNERAEMFIGVYGHTRGIDEFMAEAFQEYKNCRHPSKYAIEVGKIIDKWFKR